MTNAGRRPFTQLLTLGALAIGTASVAVAGCDDSSTTQADSPSGDAGATPDAAVESKCTPPTGEGTVHRGGSLAEDDEVWTEAASPHVIDFTLSIRAGQRLTIEPCAVVRLRAGHGMLVQGTLSAEGAADRPITIERADTDEPWTTIEVRQAEGVRLAHATIEGGGFPSNGRLDEVAMVDVRGDQDLPPQGTVHVDHVTLRGSASLGLMLREGGALASSSSALTVTGSASYPVSSWARSAGSVPTGVYTGNTTDEIILVGSGTRDAVREDATFTNRGVPYFVRGSELRVAGDGAVATLTLAAGVTLRFAKGSRLHLDATSTSDPATGAVDAAGTAAEPVVFTSAEAAPAAGDWVGITMKGTPAATTRIDHAKIAFAGAPSGISSYDCPSPANEGFTNEGAVIIHGGQPGSPFVTNTAIEDSAGDGVVRGWTGDPIDFLSSNSFARVARCTQTLPKPSAGVCPTPAPCPKS